MDVFGIAQYALQLLSGSEGNSVTINREDGEKSMVVVYAEEGQTEVKIFDTSELVGRGESVRIYSNPNGETLAETEGDLQKIERLLSGSPERADY